MIYTIVYNTKEGKRDDKIDEIVFRKFWLERERDKGERRPRERAQPKEGSKRVFHEPLKQP